jgi:hypothetical protein
VNSTRIVKIASYVQKLNSGKNQPASRATFARSRFEKEVVTDQFDKPEKRFKLVTTD